MWGPTASAPNTASGRSSVPSATETRPKVEKRNTANLKNDHDPLSGGFWQRFMKEINSLFLLGRNPHSTEERPAIERVEAQEAGASQVDWTYCCGDMGAWRGNGAVGDQGLCRKVRNAQRASSGHIMMFWRVPNSSDRAVIHPIVTIFSGITEWRGRSPRVLTPQRRLIVWRQQRM